MPMQSFEELCRQLIDATSERSAIELLKRRGYWDDESCWRKFDDNENNFSIIGNQQSAAEKALVEKLTNAIDAVLINACFENDVAPDGPSAPKSIIEAQTRFFQIPQGQLANLNASQRTGLAQHIHLLVQGTKGAAPTLSIVDSGEGQSPRKFSTTFCSLAKSNKFRIPFVQGKFNMGGTGALQFCGDHCLQLIVSKRSPLCPVEDNTLDRQWGFTVIRRHRPRGNERSSVFEYLAPKGEIPAFAAQELPLLPDEAGKKLARPLGSGTMVRLYDYQLPRGLRGTALFDLNYKLSELLAAPALPIRLVEMREGYRGHSFSVTMAGLVVRLIDSRDEVLESGFPASGSISVGSSEVSYRVFVIKAGKQKNFIDKTGIGFFVNGQQHAGIPKHFFTRARVGLSYLKDCIYVLLECSYLDSQVVEELFMNDRERLREGKHQRHIEKELETLLSQHPGLKELNSRRRAALLQDKLQDNKPLLETLDRIIRRSPSLASIFVTGTQLADPLSVLGAKQAREFEGRQWPTFFAPSKLYTESAPKTWQENRRVKIEFRTDAVNDYFDRPQLPGQLSCSMLSNPLALIYSLWNGHCVVHVDFPKGAKLGTRLDLTFRVSDEQRVEPILCVVPCIVVEQDSQSSGTRGSAKPSAQGEDGKEKQPSKLQIPPIQEVYREDWEAHGFDEFACIKAYYSKDTGYDLYCNMDNKHFLHERNASLVDDRELLSVRYKSALSLICMAVAYDFRDKQSMLPTVYSSAAEAVSDISRALAPIIIPMIVGLGERLRADTVD